MAMHDWDLTHAIRRLGATWRRWRADVRGTLMVTSAVTLPLLIIILFGIWYMFWWLAVKQTLHYAVQDAAKQASEFGRYWVIDPAADADIIYPEDIYDLEARRIIETRLRDIRNWSTATLANALVVRVEEPLLAMTTTADAGVVQEGWIENLCDQHEAITVGEDWRHPENIRMRVYAELSLPVIPVEIPYMAPITVTLSDRAVGYVQCPRWDGQREDQSHWLAPEYPALPFRYPSTPSYPTVTPDASAPTSPPPTRARP
jgi:hypothetical protein